MGGCALCGPCMWRAQSWICCWNMNSSNQYDERKTHVHLLPIATAQSVTVHRCGCQTHSQHGDSLDRYKYYIFPDSHFFHPDFRWAGVHVGCLLSNWIIMDETGTEQSAFVIHHHNHINDSETIVILLNRHNQHPNTPHWKKIPTRMHCLFGTHDSGMMHTKAQIDVLIETSIIYCLN